MIICVGLQGVPNAGKLLGKSSEIEALPVRSGEAICLGDGLIKAALLFTAVMACPSSFRHALQPQTTPTGGF